MGWTGSLLVQAEQLRQFMTANRDDQCKCWREDADKPPHSIVTAWVLLSLALYKQPAFPEEIDGVLRRQGPTGWWSMFPSTIDEKNASTSATALTALALHSQLERNLVTGTKTRGVELLIERPSG